MRVMWFNFCRLLFLLFYEKNCFSRGVIRLRNLLRASMSAADKWKKLPFLLLWEYILIILLLLDLFIRKKPSNPFILVDVAGLYGTGLSQIHVSKRLKVSRCGLENGIKKFKELGRYHDLKRSEYLKRISGRDVDNLGR